MLAAWTEIKAAAAWTAAAAAAAAAWTELRLKQQQVFLEILSIEEMKCVGGGQVCRCCPVGEECINSSKGKSVINCVKC